MATVKIKSPNGKDAGELDLVDGVFGVEPNAHCVRSAVNHHLAARRSGTHSTKTRGEVRGGGRKPWRQKGTGRARHGSIRSPIWRGGSVTFGPRPRSYRGHLNRKVGRSAMRSVLSELIRTERLIAVESFGLDEIKTKKLASMLDALGVSGSALLITDQVDRNVFLSSRNLPSVDCTTVNSPNVYDLLTHDYVVATKAALERLGEAYS